MPVWISGGVFRSFLPAVRQPTGQQRQQMRHGGAVDGGKVDPSGRHFNDTLFLTVPRLSGDS